MKNKYNIFSVLTGAVFCAVMLLSVQASANPPAMTNYCVQPPFLVTPKQPNVLVVLDNSGSMNCLAFQSSYDPAQFTSGNYYGYFNPIKNYRYDTAVTPNRWVPTLNAMNTGTAANPIASGNLLNWIATSRYDAAKKILIGGRASAGAYAAADRTTNPVKLYGNSDATTGYTCTTNNKSYDSSTSSLIFPFVGDYNYSVATGNTNTFSITFNDPTAIKLYPNKNYPGSNPVYSFPAAWVPSSGILANAYQVIDETTANTSDYITNKTTTEQALFDFDHANAALAAASGTISSITVHAYAKKSASSTLYLQAVLWGAVVGPDLVQPSGLSALSTNWADIPFDYPTNPTTGAAWQWSDFTSTIALQRLKAFGVKTVGASGALPTSSLYATVSQVYIQINVSSPASGGPYKIIVDQGSTPASGILDSLSSEVRFGLANYNPPGGQIAAANTYIDFNSVPNIISTISDTLGTTTTPLSETIYEMVRYIRQEPTYASYHTSDYILGCSGATAGSACGASVAPTVKDPFYFGGTYNQYVPCTQTYIMLMTDGEPYGDGTIPGSSTTSPYAECSLTNIKACSGRLCDKNTHVCTAVSPRYAGTSVGQSFPNSGTDYLIDVVYWARTKDMRPGHCSTTTTTECSVDLDCPSPQTCDSNTVPTVWRKGLPGMQNVYFYPVYLFGRNSTLLADAAIYGGFQDLDNTGKPDCTTKPEKCYRDSNNDGHIYSVRHNFCSNQAPTFAITCTIDADCPAGGTCLEPDAPITYYEGDDGYALEASITSAMNDILRRAASGTAASVLASGEGSGANLLQSIFYPKRSISNQSDITWTSTLQNLWYYLDPKTSNSSIRENSTDTGSGYELNLDADRIIHFWFDSTAQSTMANLFADADADGVADSVTPSAVVDVNDIKNLWEAGLMLWNTNPANRTIYSNVNGSAGMTSFVTANLINTTPTLQSLLNTDVTGRSATDNTTVATNIVNYIRGVDPSSASVTTPAAATIDYRSRSTGIDLSSPKNNTITDTVTINGVAWSEAAKVWKLGDIVNSTPRVVSWIPQNSYHIAYNDTTYSSFVKSSTYITRGMVFAGANDGMLHAFKLGTLDLGTSGNIKAKLCEDTNSNSKCDATETTKSNLGKESWAFIPKGALPYLQYFADPNYCHLYYVDSTPYVFDASIEAPGVHVGDYWSTTRSSSSWRSILIGGMRLGGACTPKLCRTTASGAFTATMCSSNADCTALQTCEVNTPRYCQTTATGAFTSTTCTTNANCTAAQTCVAKNLTVGTPAPGIGYSSYFALDITNPAAPQFMWEFSDPSLGFATSGPAIVKIKDRISGTTASSPVSGHNGKWFAVFASGPTGPIESTQSKGFSNQPLNLFVLDLKTGTLLRTVNTAIPNAFGGSLSNATVDYDLDYQDDAVYLGFTKAEHSPLLPTDSWNKGGVIRLVTRKNLTGNAVSTVGDTALNPANWVWSYVVDNIGSVTSSVQNLAHYTPGSRKPDKAYLFFGTGRYFYTMDDSSTPQALYGVVEPCLSKIKNITTSSSPICDDNGHNTTPSYVCASTSATPPRDMVDIPTCLVNTSSTLVTTALNGWYINLDVPASGSITTNERMITDPLAAPTGTVFFTTFAPSTDICTYGGKSYLWAVKYDTGNSVTGYLKGKGLLQVSTGAIQEINLTTDFGATTDVTHKLGRRTFAFDGVPPSGQGLSLIVPPKAVDKIMHIRKK
ncbi:MAG: PilC/PilY family type IV pilus protein [Thermodesulfovibrionales bacterium]